MTLVVDASAIVDLLLRNASGDWVRKRLAGADDDELFSVAHVDAEAFSAFARLHRAGELSAEEVDARLARLGALVMTRAPITTGLLADAWALRSNVAARDALYVALARRVDAALLTTDARLARAASDLAVS